MPADALATLGAWASASMVLTPKRRNIPSPGRVTHMSVSNITIIGSDNDLSPGRRQAIILINAAIL